MEEIALMGPPNSSARAPSAQQQQQQQMQQQQPPQHQQQQQQQQELSDSQRRGTTAARPQKEHNLNCPRCNSTNTKFCYYNNYSLTQPRYFCKTCRRYWTQGGSLRNVPVGGGSRKNKRCSSSSSTASQQQQSFMTSTPTSTITSSSTSSMAMLSELNPTLGPSLSNLMSMSSSNAPGHPHHHHHHHQNPNNKMIHLHGQDLNLAFSSPAPNPQDYTLFQQGRMAQQVPNKGDGGGVTKSAKVELTNGVSPPSAAAAAANSGTSSTSIISSSSAPQLSALELLRTGMASAGLTSFVPITMSLPDSNGNNPMYVSGFPGLQEYKPDHLMMGFHHHNHNATAAPSNNSIRFADHAQENGATDDGGGARLLFPFGDINSKLANNELVDQMGNKSGHHQPQQQQQGSSHGYWNGMLGGGGGTSW